MQIQGFADAILDTIKNYGGIGEDLANAVHQADQYLVSSDYDDCYIALSALARGSLFTKYFIHLYLMLSCNRFFQCLFAAKLSPCMLVKSSIHA